ncbi:hypothetical protein F4804DRAFT_87963 [Jackrogersella minutella]|nr:hypothetical protein F4804DRAFT_87963 [Jackrogersella minutella]
MGYLATLFSGKTTTTTTTMASNQHATTVTSPLSMMKELSRLVSLYEPEGVVTRQSTDPKAPKLILIASWMDARDLHIAKYITQYQAIYPTSKILLVKFFFDQSVFASSTRAAVRPAVAYIQSQISSGVLSASPARPEILVHLFSNGGSTTMRTLYQQFQAQPWAVTFPLHAAVYDSCPGVYSFPTTYSVYVLQLPPGILRLLAAPFITAFIVGLWIWFNPLRMISGEDFLSTNSRLHNDMKLVNQTNRSYIYGKADVMVDWRHVERHAEQASARGLAVRTELFENSPHVSHMRTDGNRYWRTVTETWNKAMMWY